MKTALIVVGVVAAGVLLWKVAAAAESGPHSWDLSQRYLREAELRANPSLTQTRSGAGHF